MLSEINSVSSEQTLKNGEKRERLIITLQITLSKDELDTTNLGYQAPLPEGEVETFKEEFVRAQAQQNKSERRGLTAGFRGRRNQGRQPARSRSRGRNEQQHEETKVVSGQRQSRFST